MKQRFDLSFGIFHFYSANTYTVCLFIEKLVFGFKNKQIIHSAQGKKELFWLLLSLISEAVMG